MQSSGTSFSTSFRRVFNFLRSKLKKIIYARLFICRYKQCIDIEGESGLVIRGIGTAMYLTKLSENQLSPVPLIEGASKE